MTNFSLSKEEIDHFVKFGFIQVPDCFDRAFAKQWTDEAYGRLGYDPNDPSTWEKPIVHMPNDAWVNVKEFSPKAYAVICQLLGGEDRIPENIRWGNGFIVNFSLGADSEWIPPSPEAGGWHKDGDFFHHFLDSPEQGLLLIVIWKKSEERRVGKECRCRRSAGTDGRTARW